MPRKRTSEKMLPASETTGVEKPRRARARTTRKKAETGVTDQGHPASDSISNLAGAVASGGASQSGLDPCEIANLAYSYWEARGGQGGSPEEDWYRAEQELRARAEAVVGG